MVFALPDLTLPLPTSNSMLAELHGLFAGDCLRQFDHAFGFAEQSSFFRACRRWFDVSPGKYRSQLLRQAQGEAGP